MDNLTELKARVIEYLSGLSAFENVSVIAAFPELERAYPLKNPVVAVSLKSVELIPAGLGGYLGGENALYGASALVSLGFGIYCPKAETCGALYETLSAALLNASWAGFHKIEAAPVEYAQKPSAYHLPATAALRAAFIAPRQEERLFTGTKLTVKE